MVTAYWPSQIIPTGPAPGMSTVNGSGIRARARRALSRRRKYTNRIHRASQPGAVAPL